MIPRAKSELMNLCILLASEGVVSLTLLCNVLCGIGMNLRGNGISIGRSRLERLIETSQWRSQSFESATQNLQFVSSAATTSCGPLELPWRIATRLQQPTPGYALEKNVTSAGLTR